MVSGEFHTGKAGCAEELLIAASPESGIQFYSPPSLPFTGYCSLGIGLRTVSSKVAILLILSVGHKDYLLALYALHNSVPLRNQTSN